MSNPTAFNLLDRYKFIRLFIVLFYALAIYNWLNGLFLYQLSPILFYTPFDGTNWLLMQANIHNWLLGNNWGCILFDFIYYILPGFFWFCCIKHKRIPVLFVCLPWLIFNWIYILNYITFPSNSIEGHVAYLVFPFLFAQKKLTNFYYILNSIRYLFLFFFASSGIWKIRTGSITNPEQMSGILLMQHKEFLIAFPDHWYTQFIYFLIRHESISQSLFIISTIIEILFIIGFVTKKVDYKLFYLFLIFLAADFFIMRIPYFIALPFAIPLLFCKGKKEPLPFK